MTEPRPSESTDGIAGRLFRRLFGRFRSPSPLGPRPLHETWVHLPVRPDGVVSEQGPGVGNYDTIETLRGPDIGVGPDHGCRTIYTLSQTGYPTALGKKHRLDGPAVVSLENELAEEWWVNGVCTREDDPAVLRRRVDGTVRVALFYVNGAAHRLDGPAFYENVRPGEPFDTVGRRSQGRIVFNDVVGSNTVHELHMEAEADGSTTYRAYAVHGEIFSRERFERIRDALAEGAPLEWALAFESGQQS